MKQISYSEWDARFEIHSGDAEWSEIEDQKDALEFFDNGAVRDAEGTYVVKADDVWTKKGGAS